MAEHEPDDMLSVQEVCRYIGGAVKPPDPNTIYRWIKSGKFPKPIRISHRMSRWRRADVEAALQEMIRKSRGEL